jgi:hypothetical protein
VCTGIATADSPAPVFKEAIRFSGYRFPTAIPPDVFGTSASPDASESPQPTSP